MNLFNESIREVLSLIEAGGASARTFPYDPAESWPRGRRGQIVLRSDTALELGNPGSDSVSFLLWTDDLSLIEGNRMVLLGPDIRETGETVLPFGKAVLVSGKGFNEENNYDCYRAMEKARYDMNIDGYMMKSIPRYMREWIRISQQARDRGFSMKVAANRLIEQLLSHEFVHRVSVLMITEPGEPIARLRKTGEQAARYIGAMAKMTEEMDFDCSSCQYFDICSDASGLRSMRESLKEKRNV